MQPHGSILLLVLHCGEPQSLMGQHNAAHARSVLLADDWTATFAVYSLFLLTIYLCTCTVLNRTNIAAHQLSLWPISTKRVMAPNPVAIQPLCLQPGLVATMSP